jgi:hypothetical protein
MAVVHHLIAETGITSIIEFDNLLLRMLYDKEPGPYLGVALKHGAVKCDDFTYDIEQRLDIGSYIIAGKYELYIEPSGPDGKIIEYRFADGWEIVKNPVKRHHNIEPHKIADILVKYLNAEHLRLKNFATVNGMKVAKSYALVRDIRIPFRGTSCKFADVTFV